MSHPTCWITREQLATLRAQIVDLANPAAAPYLREDTAVTALSLLKDIETQTREARQ